MQQRTTLWVLVMGVIVAMAQHRADTAQAMDSSSVDLAIRYENGALWATVPEMPGVFATGDTMDELRESLQEGISLWLAKPGQDALPVALGELEKKQTLASATFAHA